MHIQAVLDPKSWAERTFGSVHLHDLRRTRRAVQAAIRLAEHPLGSLPAPAGEGRAERHKRAERETNVWMRQVQAIGTPAPGSTSRPCRGPRRGSVPVLP